MSGGNHEELGEEIGRRGSKALQVRPKCKFDVVFQVTHLCTKTWNEHDGADLVQSFATIGDVNSDGDVHVDKCRTYFPTVDGIVREALAKVRFDIAAKIVRL